MNRAVRTIALASVALISLSGCASNSSKKTAPATAHSSSYQGSSDARADAFPIDFPAWAKLGYKWDWTGFPYVAPRGHITNLIVYPDLIVAQDTGSTVSLLEASNGSQRWSNTLANPLTRFVGLARVADSTKGDVLLACGQSEIFFLASATGTLLDRQSLEKVVNSHPLIAGDRAIFGSPTGEVYAHWLGRGLKVWGFGTSAAIEADVVSMGNGAVASVNQSGQITFLTEGGSLLAQAQIFGAPGAALASGNGLLFIASVDQSLYAYSADGQQAWRLRTNAPLHYAPRLNGKVLYCTIPERGLSALDSATGRSIWNNTDVHGEVVAIRKGRLLVREAEQLVELDPGSGQIMESIAVSGLQTLATDKFEDGNLYAVSNSGVIAKFLPK